MPKKSLIALAAVVILVGGVAMYFYGRSFWVPVYRKIVGKRTVPEVISIYGEAARDRLASYFSAAGVSYPPEEIFFLGLKDSAEMEVWAKTDLEARPKSQRHEGAAVFDGISRFGIFNESTHSPVDSEAGSTAELHHSPHLHFPAAPLGAKFIRKYTIQALSGVAGPKLEEGDRQVPEGLYRIEGLNPNSSYHLSIKLNYPNAFDLKNAKTEGRDEPGSNIFIHGKAVSVGCLAMGDSAIEELFVLTNDVGRENVYVAIAPTDPREGALPTTGQPAWIGQLYGELNSYFDRFRQK